MSELPTNHEHISKEQVIAAYAVFVQAGIDEPGKLNSENPEVQKAEALQAAFLAEMESKAKGNPEAERLVELEKTAFYFNVGFRAQSFVDDLYVWLDQDIHDIENLEPRMPAALAAYKAKLKEVEALSPRQEEEPEEGKPTLLKVEEKIEREPVSDEQLIELLSVRANQQTKEVKEIVRVWFGSKLNEIKKLKKTEKEKAKADLVKFIESLFWNDKIGVIGYLDRLSRKHLQGKKSYYDPELNK